MQKHGNVLKKHAAVIEEHCDVIGGTRRCSKGNMQMFLKEHGNMIKDTGECR